MSSPKEIFDSVLNQPRGPEPLAVPPNPPPVSPPPVPQSEAPEVTFAEIRSWPEYQQMSPAQRLATFNSWQQETADRLGNDENVQNKLRDQRRQVLLSAPEEFGAEHITPDYRREGTMALQRVQEALDAGKPVIYARQAVLTHHDRGKIETALGEQGLQPDGTHTDKRFDGMYEAGFDAGRLLNGLKAQAGELWNTIGPALQGETGQVAEQTAIRELSSERKQAYYETTMRFMHPGSLSTAFREQGPIADGIYREAMALKDPFGADKEKLAKLIGRRMQIEQNFLGLDTALSTWRMLADNAGPAVERAGLGLQRLGIGAARMFYGDAFQGALDANRGQDRQLYRDIMRNIEYSSNAIGSHADALSVLSGQPVERLQAIGNTMSLVEDPFFVAGFASKPVTIGLKALARVGGETLAKAAGRAAIEEVGKIGAQMSEKAITVEGSQVGKWLQKTGEKAVAADLAGERVATGVQRLTAGAIGAAAGAAVPGHNPIFTLAGAVLGTAGPREGVAGVIHQIATPPAAWLGEMVGNRARAWVGSGMARTGRFIDFHARNGMRFAVDFNKISPAEVATLLGQVGKDGKPLWEWSYFDWATKNQIPSWVVRTAVGQGLELPGNLLRGGVHGGLFGYLTLGTLEGAAQQGAFGGALGAASYHLLESPLKFLSTLNERGQHAPSGMLLGVEQHPEAQRALQIRNRDFFEKGAFNPETRQKLGWMNESLGPDGISLVADIMDLGGVATGETPLVLLGYEAFTDAKFARFSSYEGLPESAVNDFLRDRNSGVDVSKKVYGTSRGSDLLDEWRSLFDNEVKSSQDPNSRAGGLSHYTLTNHRGEVVQAFAVPFDKQVDNLTTEQGRANFLAKVGHEAFHRLGIESREIAVDPYEPNLDLAIRAEQLNDGIRDTNTTRQHLLDEVRSRYTDAELLQVAEQHLRASGLSDKGVALKLKAMRGSKEGRDAAITDALDELLSVFGESYISREASHTREGLSGWAYDFLHGKLKQRFPDIYEQMNTQNLKTLAPRLAQRGVRFGFTGIPYDANGRAVVTAPEWMQGVKSPDSLGLRIALARFVTGRDILRHEVPALRAELENRRLERDAYKTIPEPRAPAGQPKGPASLYDRLEGAQSQRQVEAELSGLQLKPAEINTLRAEIDQRTGESHSWSGDPARDLEQIKALMSQGKPGGTPPEVHHPAPAEGQTLARIFEDESLRDPKDHFAMMLESKRVVRRGEVVGRTRQRYVGIPTPQQLDAVRTAALNGEVSTHTYETLRALAERYRRQGAGTAVVLHADTEPNSGDRTVATRNHYAYIQHFSVDFDPITDAKDPLLPSHLVSTINSDPTLFDRWWAKDSSPEQRQHLIDLLNERGAEVSIKGYPKPTSRGAQVPVALRRRLADAKKELTKAKTPEAASSAERKVATAQADVDAVQGRSVHDALREYAGVKINVKIIDRLHVEAKIRRLQDVMDGKLDREGLRAFWLRELGEKKERQAQQVADAEWRSAMELIGGEGRKGVFPSVKAVDDGLAAWLAKIYDLGTFRDVPLTEPQHGALVRWLGYNSAAVGRDAVLGKRDPKTGDWISPPFGQGARQLATGRMYPSGNVVDGLLDYSVPGLHKELTVSRIHHVSDDTPGVASRPWYGAAIAAALSPSGKNIQVPVEDVMRGPGLPEVQQVLDRIRTPGPAPEPAPTPAEPMSLALAGGGRKPVEVFTSVLEGGKP